MNKKRIFAWAALLLFAALLLLLVAALLLHAGPNVIMAVLFCLIILPVLFYALSMAVRAFTDKKNGSGR